MGDRAASIQFYNEAVKTVHDKSQSTYLAHAYSLFSSACMVDPTYGSAHYQAGNNNSDMNLLPAALACWRRGLECENTPDEKGKMLINMGWRLHSLGRAREAVEFLHAGLKIDPKLHLGVLSLSLCHQLFGDPKMSLQYAEQAHEMAPDDDHTEVGLAFASLFAGQYARGLKHFERRFKWRLHNFQHFPYPKWEGQMNATIYLVADQGLGDTLSYARFVEIAAKRSKHIHMAVQSELVRLFTYAFAHLDNVTVIPMPCPFPSASYWSTFISLPFALGLTDEEIVKQPHIKYEAPEVSDRWKVPDRKFHIGIAWGGSALNDIDKWRNIPLHLFYELYQVPGIQLYSLQVDQRSKELQDSGAAAVIRDLAPYIRDVTDTLSILKHLDLVVTCESALGHISALAGRECWIPYSYSGLDYRLGLRGEQKLWTPKHRVFQQGEDQQWEPVFVKLIEALRRKVK